MVSFVSVTDLSEIQLWLLPTRVFTQIEQMKGDPLPFLLGKVKHCLGQKALGMVGSWATVEVGTSLAASLQGVNISSLPFIQP